MFLFDSESLPSLNGIQCVGHSPSRFFVVIPGTVGHWWVPGLSRVVYNDGDLRCVTPFVDSVLPGPISPLSALSRPRLSPPETLLLSPRTPLRAESPSVSVSRRPSVRSSVRVLDPDPRRLPGTLLTWDGGTAHALCK